MRAQKVPNSLLEAQAKKLYDLGIGEEIGRRTKQGRWSLGAYQATLPDPCLLCLAEAEATKDGSPTNRLWYILVEPRAGLVVSCRAGNIVLSASERCFVSLNERHLPMAAYWTLFHNGAGYRGRAANDCRAEFGTEFAKEVGVLPASVMVGVSAFLHHAEVVTELHTDPNGHAMDLVGSVHAQDRHRIALFALLEGRGEIHFVGGSLGHPRYGAAYSRQCQHRVP